MEEEEATAAELVLATGKSVVTEADLWPRDGATGAGLLTTTVAAAAAEEEEVEAAREDCRGAMDDCRGVVASSAEPEASSKDKKTKAWF